MISSQVEITVKLFSSVTGGQQEGTNVYNAIFSPNEVNLPKAPATPQEALDLFLNDARVQSIQLERTVT